jgi:hypothetical protein
MRRRRGRYGEEREGGVRREVVWGEKAWDGDDVIGRQLR